MTDKREKVENALYDANVDTRRYFYPIHQMAPFTQYKTFGAMRNTANVSAMALTLPLWAGLGSHNVARICEIVKEALR